MVLAQQVYMSNPRTEMKAGKHVQKKLLVIVRDSSFGVSICAINLAVT